MASDPETWIDQHGDIMYRFALARVRNESLAEELVQEALVAAFKSRDHFKGESAERSWMISILKNKICDHFRKSSKEVKMDNIDIFSEDIAAQFDEGGHWRVFEGMGPVDWETTPDALIEKREFMETLENCLSKLPQKISQVFTSREIDGLETDEVCKLFGISPTNLWVILHRARAGLRECLEKNWFFSRVSEEAKGPKLKSC